MKRARFSDQRWSQLTDLYALEYFTIAASNGGVVPTSECWVEFIGEANRRGLAFAALAEIDELERRFFESDRYRAFAERMRRR